ncbi:putative F-box protein PP2-B12 [Amaranthus tricolor]|uniref:putative F-box protein PP2-B12 n=1 Tax=Amaranthus tricolor TaxID=29722 RepID=UPI00258AB1BD|nr:putative F-box protein PP2-B12 [Amaranthus tricolor]
MSTFDFTDLPEDCISYILTLSSPSDVLRSSAVSKQLLMVSESDSVWDNFLPSDCYDIISRSPAPFSDFKSKKDLFLHLCNTHVFLNENTLSFSLDKRSGKKCYMLSARALKIEWADTLQYWSWFSMPESRFPEVAQLQEVCWLDIVGEINTKLLTQNTTYGAYLLFKVDIDSFRGFNNPEMKVLCVCESDNKQESSVKHSDLEEDRRLSQKDVLIKRDDGWMEIEMGRYKVGSMGNGDDKVKNLQMIMRESKELHWKSGLIVQGIEIRPLD